MAILYREQRMSSLAVLILGIVPGEAVADCAVPMTTASIMFAALRLPLLFLTVGVLVVLGLKVFVSKLTPAAAWFSGALVLVGLGRLSTSIASGHFITFPIQAFLPFDLDFDTFRVLATFWVLAVIAFVFASSSIPWKRLSYPTLAGMVVFVVSATIALGVASHWSAYTILGPDVCPGSSLQTGCCYDRWDIRGDRKFLPSLVKKVRGEEDMEVQQ